MESSRRSFITGLVSFAATAPAIVRASSLMRVRPDMILTDDPPYNVWTCYRLGYAITRDAIDESLSRAFFADTLKNGYDMLSLDAK